MTSRRTCTTIGAVLLLVGTALVVAAAVTQARVEGPNPGAGRGLAIGIGYAYGVLTGFVGLVVVVAARQREDLLARAGATFGGVLLAPLLLVAVGSVAG